MTTLPRRDTHPDQHTCRVVDNSHSTFAQLRSVPLKAVTLEEGFWNDYFQQCINVTEPHLWQRMTNPDQGHALANLEIKAGLREGEFQGTFWQDEWVYKWIEAAAYLLHLTGNPDYDQRMDQVIAVIEKAQDPDGYLASQILKAKERFTRTIHHELYVMGHLLTAACIHHRVTGKRSLLDVAIRTADYLYREFKSPPEAWLHFGHNPSYIMGLIELYRTVKDERYLELADIFITRRGSHPGGTEQLQDMTPLREETQVVGHAVFFTYLFAGAADAYMETGDATLMAALERLWLDLTRKKMYVNGGVCAVHYGRTLKNSLTCEAAGYPYDLPSATAYNETCAQIGNFLWNWRMFLITQEEKYADIMELSFYNSILSGINRKGDRWFYANILCCRGEHHNEMYPQMRKSVKGRFNPAQTQEKAEICCPSNLQRLQASLHGYLYALSDTGITLAHYTASSFEGTLNDNQPISLRVETDYPWDGHIKITLTQAPSTACTLGLRIPAWVKSPRIAINGEPCTQPVTPGSIHALNRAWKTGDEITLDLPMPTRLVTSHPHMEHTRNQVAVMRGPLVYCLEQCDLPEGVPVDSIHIPRDAQFTTRFEPDLLGGVTVLETQAIHHPELAWDDALYQELPQDHPGKAIKVRLLPYFAWANRDSLTMNIWQKLEGSTKPPASTS